MTKSDAESQLVNSPQTFGHDAEMTAVLEHMLHPNDMFLVFGIGIIELLKDLRLFPSGHIPVRRSARLIDRGKGGATHMLS